MVEWSIEDEKWLEPERSMMFGNQASISTNLDGTPSVI